MLKKCSNSAIKNYLKLKEKRVLILIVKAQIYIIETYLNKEGQKEKMV